ncbi:MAG: 23S rRNA (pseudouridine(1915)-N(3))-methyltransferase RlmH [Lachnospiraceae bacterium]|nr:23S rRNA (pseudouridine(1915)-N(3))-methyltransferase RlmH [Lachnospiraceae bacterium]
MKIKVVAVGRCRETFFTDACREYEKRLSAYVRTEIVEVKDEALAENASAADVRKVLDTEGKRILEKLRDQDHVIALDLHGDAFDSPGMAERLQRLMLLGKSSIVFVIGGSAGLSPEVLARADARWSFSKLTFPHQLMRVILLEQVYRSFRIINHEPYHK